MGEEIMIQGNQSVEANARNKQDNQGEKIRVARRKGKKLQANEACDACMRAAKTS